MTPKPENPFAFPIPSSTSPNGQFEYGATGMTLRDYFAAAALPEVIRQLKIHADGQNEFHVVSYEIADALLAERAKQ